jgi:FO synthase subunit 1
MTDFKDGTFTVRPPQYVTFSKNIFVPVTNVCRNNCDYCGFRRDVDAPDARLVTVEEVKKIFEANDGASEALFTFGEKPEENPVFRERLASIGYSSIVDYALELCKIALQYNLLPHTNAGVMSYAELKKLQPYNASMGLMLETTAFSRAHENSIGKNPVLRLRTIESAGRLKIPFTTGILVGIGEKLYDRRESLEAIKKLHERHDHIQEVIIQPFVPKPNTPMKNYPLPSMEEMRRTVYMARQILPDEVAIQIPPNLSPLELVRSGANDLGGISSQTIDYINPEAAWPTEADIRTRVYPIPLRERLPVYPRFVRMGWYSSEISELIKKLSNDEGLRA